MSPQRIRATEGKQQRPREQEQEQSSPRRAPALRGELDPALDSGGEAQEGRAVYLFQRDPDSSQPQHPPESAGGGVGGRAGGGDAQVPQKEPCT